MKKVITYGTYDLLHYGHIALLKRAKELGDYLIVGVTSDTFDKERGKLNVKQSLAERIEAVRETGIADMIIVEEYEGQKISDVQKYNVDIFTVGSDWIGKFDYLKDYCDVVYLQRTQGISSTELRNQVNPGIRVGMVGLDSVSVRFYDDSLFVGGMGVTCVYDDDWDRAERYCARKWLRHCGSYQELLEHVDAVFINVPIDRHYALVMEALEHGRHVICNGPTFLNAEEAERATRFAMEKNLVLFDGIKTLYFPAFERLMLLVHSGLIGSVKNIDVSCSQIPDNFKELRKNPYEGSMYDWGAAVLLPILKLLGCENASATFYTFEDQGFSYLTQGILAYPHATATFKAGRGIKVEGSMTITGTNGYAYVPAPWWKTEYFEIRHEDLRDTRKYFYKYAGNGMRYMILEFVQMINGDLSGEYKFTHEERLKMAQLISQAVNGTRISLN